MSCPTGTPAATPPAVSDARAGFAPSARGHRLRGPLAALAVALLALAFQLPSFDRTASLLDEGHILQFADIVSRGGELYRDASTLALPGAFYLLALAFALTDPSILVARWIVVFEFSAFAAVLFLLLRRLTAPAVAASGVALLFVYKIWAFPHWQMYSYSTTAQLCLAGALYGVVRYHESARRAHLVGAGIATGLAIVCKQDYGMAGLLGLNAALFLSLRGGGRAARARAGRVFAAYNAPVAAIGVAVAYHFLRQGLLAEMLQQTLLQHLQGIATGLYSPAPPLLPLFEPSPLLRSAYGLGAYVPSILVTLDWPLVSSSAFYRESVLWDTCLKVFFCAPYAIAAIGALRLWRRRGALCDPRRRGAFLQESTLVCFAATALLALHRPVDAVHVGVLYWSPLLLLLLWSDRLRQEHPRAARIAALAGLLPALLVVGYSGRLAWRLHDQFDTPLQSERAGVRVRADEALVIDAVVAHLRSQTRSGERVAVLPYFPLLSFLARRDAPSPELYVFWPVEVDPERQRRAIEALETRAADVAVYHFTQWPQLPELPVFAPELFAYLVEHWEIERVFSDPGWGYMLAGLRRSQGPDAGIALLAAADTPRLFVEEPGAGLRAVTGAARDRMLQRTAWPFRSVLALRPSSGGRRSVLTLAADVAEHSELHTAIGVDPRHWFAFPPASVTYSIRAVVDGARVALFEQRLDPQRSPADRGWVEIRLDLSDFAGRRVDLEFTTACEARTGAVPAMAAFAVPRLVRP